MEKRLKVNNYILLAAIIVLVLVITDFKTSGFIAQIKEPEQLAVEGDEAQAPQTGTGLEDDFCNTYTSTDLGGETEFIMALYSMPRRGPVLVHGRPYSSPNRFTEVVIRGPGPDEFFGTGDDVLSPRRMESGMPWTFAKMSANERKEALIFVAMENPRIILSQRLLAIEQSGPDGIAGNFDDPPRQVIPLRSPPTLTPHDESFSFDIAVLPNGETVVVWYDSPNYEFNSPGGLHILSDGGTGKFNTQNARVYPSLGHLGGRITKNGFSLSFKRSPTIQFAYDLVITDFGPNFQSTQIVQRQIGWTFYYGYDLLWDSTDDGKVIALLRGKVVNYQIQPRSVDVVLTNGRLNENTRLVQEVYTAPPQLFIRDVAVTYLDTEPHGANSPAVLLVLLSPSFNNPTAPTFVAGVYNGLDGVFGYNPRTGSNDDVVIAPRFTGASWGSYHRATYNSATFSIVNNQYRIFDMFMAGPVGITSYAFCG